MNVAKSGTLLHSLTCRYVSVGLTRLVLNHWKFENQFHLNQLSSPLKTVLIDRRNLDLIPIPQGSTRSWKLAGSPAVTLARTIANELNRPMIYFLKLNFKNKFNHECTRNERMQMQNPFIFTDQTTNRVAGRTALIVDDFLTTGQTLRFAAQTLKQAGYSQLHGFALGYRPRFCQTDQFCVCVKNIPEKQNQIQVHRSST